MSANSKIEWTDHTFNPWWGCVKVNRGCKNCYAETIDHRWGGDHWGPNTRRRMILGEWSKIAGWDRNAMRDFGRRARVFCASMADLFENHTGLVVDQRGEQIAIPDRLSTYRTIFGDDGFWTVPTLRARALHLMSETKNLEWLLLTKRPQNVAEMVPPSWRFHWPDNVRIGTSVCDQRTADESVLELLKLSRCGASVFLSAEPLVGSLRLSPTLGGSATKGAKARARSGTRLRPISDLIPGTIEYGHDLLTGIDWVIVGAESGPNADAMDIEHARSLVAQCRDAGVPCFVKQLCESGRKVPFDDWPADLKVREFPVSAINAA